MTTVPTAEHVRLLLKQGHCWIDRWCDLERRAAAERKQHHERLRACPLASLAAMVETYRARMFEAEERAGRPVIQRTLPPWAKPPEPHQKRHRGLARHLSHSLSKDKG
ncbi:hypothetical protein [Cupriavidus metallidurans]|uniref:hypothetical protein n=1 Tax=Cupriavidus metallidurans TaxID=119219 RepID=UPI00055E11CF|nr:hypothetical protein [Cupriavidus metallidurans]